jgi:hypothetical protein
MKEAIFFFPLLLFNSICGFVVCVMTKIVVFIFIFFIGFMGSESLFVVLWWLVYFFSLGFVIEVVCFVLWSNLI